MLTLVQVNWSIQLIFRLLVLLLLHVLLLQVLLVLFIRLPKNPLPHH
jgi:hypothetical protein